MTEEVVEHLTAIFNESLESGIVPDEWKLANVTPIFKKGIKNDPNNYRPISLTSIIVKILESIIADKIFKHIEENNLIIDSQHGFRSNRSCLTNLLDFFHNMITEYDANRAIDIIYLDFQKAFDKVPHKKLLTKVRALGVNGNLEKWIENWLRNRKQRVVINGETSDWTNVTSGVPQGSVMGPLLFLIYINDIDTGIVSKISKFADDTKLGANVSTDKGIEGLRSDLQKLGEWSEKWQMPFNVNKCKVMHVGHHNPQEKYSLNGEELSTTEAEKDLGVIINNDFKFSTQCIEVEKRAQKLLGYIKRHFKYRNKETILTLYNSLIRPHLEYAVQFWSPTLRKDIERLERVQSRATKLIPSLRHKRYDERLATLSLFTLEKRRLRGQLIEVFKIFKGFSKLNQDIFTLNRNETRGHELKLELKRYNTNICGSFMTYSICSTWNKLTSEVVQSTSIEQFKTRLDKMLHTL